MTSEQERKQGQGGDDSSDRKEDSDRKGKGRATNQDQDSDRGQGEKQQMKEVRRPPPLPAVKGTIGAIESPSRRTFFSGSPTTLRGNHSRGPSYDTNLQFKTPDSPSPNSQSHNQQMMDDTQFRRDRPVFRSDPTLGSCFDRLRLTKKDEIRALFGA